MAELKYMQFYAKEVNKKNNKERMELAIHAPVTLDDAAHLCWSTFNADIAFGKDRKNKELPESVDEYRRLLFSTHASLCLEWADALIEATKKADN